MIQCPYCKGGAKNKKQLEIHKSIIHKEELVSELVKYPVRYDDQGQYIWDADNHMVLMIRGWGRLQYLEDAEAKQDVIGEFVAEAINEKLRKQSDGQNKL